MLGDCPRFLKRPQALVVLPERGFEARPVARVFTLLEPPADARVLIQEEICIVVFFGQISGRYVSDYFDDVLDSVNLVFTPYEFIPVKVGVSLERKKRSKVCH